MSGGRRRVFLALGSNVGDRYRYLRDAVATIESTVELVAVSAVYETEPVGGPEQASFLNVVVQINTELAGHELLELCRQCEREAARVRIEHWGPRTLDVDVLWIDGEIVADPPELLVPHPRMFERDFVLVPLADLAPDLVPKGYDPAAALDVVRVGQWGSDTL